MAVAHTILVIGYHLQKHQCDYRDLGSDYFDRLHADGLKRPRLLASRRNWAERYVFLVRAAAHAD